MEHEDEEIKADKLIDFLKEIDKELTGEIQLNAVGGTAMTLLKMKKSTIDIDFDINGRDKKIFKRVLDITPHGFKIDIFVNGLIFSQQLPEDYISKLGRIDADFENIRLYALHPIDIVVTKIGRLNDRDLQDIESCITYGKLKKEEIEERARQVEYSGDESIYQKNLEHVIEKFFKRQEKSQHRAV